MKNTFAILLCVALLAAGCGDPAAPAAPTPVAPTVVETFSGTLLPSGVNSHPFTVAQVGGVQVSLTSIQSGAAVGLGVGSSSTSGCRGIKGITAVAGSSVQISGTATVSGNFCVSVYDVGNLVESVTYTVTVNHS